MVPGRIHEGDADLLDTLGYALWPELDLHAQSLHTGGQGRRGGCKAVRNKSGQENAVTNEGMIFLLLDGGEEDNDGSITR